jgi:hypothetical protein
LGLKCFSYFEHAVQCLSNTGLLGMRSHNSTFHLGDSLQVFDFNPVALGTRVWKSWIGLISSINQSYHLTFCVISHIHCKNKAQHSIAVHGHLCGVGGFVQESEKCSTGGHFCIRIFRHRVSHKLVSPTSRAYLLSCQNIICSRIKSPSYLHNPPLTWILDTNMLTIICPGRFLGCY